MTQPLHKQRGAVTLMGALVIIITLVLMIEVLHRMAGSDILDTAIQNDSVEALFVAEAGIEHATYLFANGTTCTDLSPRTVSMGRGSFNITSSTLVGSDCSIRVAAAAGALGAQRVVEAALKNEGNLLGTANANFDDPPPPCAAPGCTPTGWTLPPGGWRDDEGPNGAGDRAAYVEKPSTGSGTITTAGSFALSPFTVTAPTSLTLYFDYRVVANGGGGSTKARLRFDVSDGTNTYAATPTVAATGSTGGYVADSVTIAISGTGPVTITEFNFQLEATSGQPKWIWLDNLDLRDPAGGGSVVLRQWREIVSN